MIGALIGDVIGSRFERYNYKAKDFELFHSACHVTDDSVMSLAIALAVMESSQNKTLGESAVHAMQQLGRRYPHAGYGGRFVHWIAEETPEPYNSLGNGAAMRVSPCGYAACTMEEAKSMAKAVTEVTHNHPEGMKGAEAVTVAIYMARNGASMEDIKAAIEQDYYALDFSLDAIRENYTFDVTCQGSVPQAIVAFLESNSFEDAVRNAISIGGDSDTIAAISGSIAEAYYGVPEHLVLQTLDRMDNTQVEILYHFEKNYPSKAILEDGSSTTVFRIIDDYLL